MFGQHPSDMPQPRSRCIGIRREATSFEYRDLHLQQDFLKKACFCRGWTSAESTDSFVRIRKWLTILTLCNV